MKHSLFPRTRRAFTLLELLAATAVLLVVMVVLLQLVGGVGEIWKSSTGKISAFQNARSAFATLNRTLARATLNTYNDYVDASGNYRTTGTSGNSTSFVPAKFARASELHFLSGPAHLIVPNANAQNNPGDAVFFQAPLGETDNNQLTSLNRTLNSTGFYIQYGDADTSLLPNWLQGLFSSTKRFRLVQYVEPTEGLDVYQTVAAGGYPAKSSGSGWLSPFSANQTSSGTSPRARVLAEDVCLLVIRPRLAPKDEEAAAALIGGTYEDETRGSILSPNYHYDSRAWQADYPSGRVDSNHKELMRNQVPPIVDVAMVSVDRRSLARFDQTSASPPAELLVPSGKFTDSAKFEEDLAAYSSQLSEARIRHRVFRTSVEIQGSKWSNTVK